MTTTDTEQSDRDLWQEPQLSSGIFVYSLLMQSYREDFADGLKAFAAAWFACYEDETELPAWFRAAIKDAEDIGLDDLDLPGQEGYEPPIDFADLDFPEDD